MNVPKDEGLFFSVFFSVCVAAALALWLALPVTHPVELESDDGDEVPVEMLTLAPAVTPEERVHRMEQALGLAEAAIEQLEPAEKTPATAPEKKK